MTDDQIDHMLAEVHSATVDAQSAARGMGLSRSESRDFIADARRLTVRVFMSQAGIMPADLVCACRVDETCRICDPVWPCESSMCQFSGPHSVTECCPTVREDAAYRLGLETAAERFTDDVLNAAIDAVSEWHAGDTRIMRCASSFAEMRAVLRAALTREEPS